MEETTVKVPVYEMKTVLNEVGEQPVDVNFTLPEYYPDISKILKCCLNPYITSKGINGTQAFVEGSAVITVIYVDDENMLNSYEYQYPFSKSFDAQKADAHTCLCAAAQTDYINCRAVSPRKIDLHGAISVAVTLEKREADEIVSEIKDKDIECRKKEINTTVMLGCSEKYITLEEEIELGAGTKDINCIIRYGGQLGTDEAKIMAGKAMTKGELYISLLYCDSEGEILNIKEKFPYSGMLEIEGAGEGCASDASASLAFLEVKPKSNAEGLLRSFTVSAKILVTVNTFCEDKICAVLDAYSKKYETKKEFADITPSRLLYCEKEDFTVKENLEFGQNDISRVYDMWCTAEQLCSKAEDGILTVSGNITAYIIALDSSDTPVFYEREIPYSYQKEIKAQGDNITPETRVNIKNCSFTLLSGGDMELRAQIGLFAGIFSCEREKVLKEIEVDREKPIKCEKKYAMVIYYAAAGDTVWDVAARYLADVEEIKQINNLESDDLQEGKMLLLPVN